MTLYLTCLRVLEQMDERFQRSIADIEELQPDSLPHVTSLTDVSREDIENGTGDWEGEAYDKSTEPPTPIDAIIWLKRKDGTYTGFKITYSNGSFGLDAKTQCSKNCMITAGYLDDGPDTNPDGAWTVGGRNPSNNNNWWYFEKFCPTFLMMYGDSFWPSCC